MGFKRVFSLLAIISLSGMFACDFYPGSTYRTRQTWRTWLVLDATSAPVCSLVGTYTLTQDLQGPGFGIRSSLSLRPEFKQDRDFLPNQASLQWELNGQFLYQINYDLNNSGRAKTRSHNQPGISLNDGDVIDTWFCLENGIMPMHTRVDWRKNMRFEREP
jgi:hypothetical protein